LLFTNLDATTFCASALYTFIADYCRTALFPNFRDSTASGAVGLKNRRVRKLQFSGRHCKF